MSFILYCHLKKAERAQSQGLQSLTHRALLVASGQQLFHLYGLFRPSDFLIQFCCKNTLQEEQWQRQHTKNFFKLNTAYNACSISASHTKDRENFQPQRQSRQRWRQGNTTSTSLETTVLIHNSIILFSYSANHVEEKGWLHKHK